MPIKYIRMFHLTLSKYAPIIDPENENMTIPPQFGGVYFEGCQSPLDFLKRTFLMSFGASVSRSQNHTLFVGFPDF